MKFPIISSLTGLVMVNSCLGNNLRPNEMNQLNDFNNQSMGNDAKEESIARELIAGGVPVDTPRKYKFFVQINGNGCSGSLVAPNVVLSAADCTASSVTLGLHKQHLEEGEEHEFYNIEHIPIVESVTHPEYQRFTSHWYDLSVIKLQWASQLYANYVVDLDTPADEFELSPGDELTILGMGLAGRGAGIPNVLQEGTVEVAHKDVCAASLGVAPTVLDTMFCAGRPGVDTCTGDFGGPVLSKVTQADQTVRWKQVGVNSKFTRCVDYQGGPGVYASVSAGYPFISQYIAKWADPTAAPPDTHPGCTDLGGFYDALGTYANCWFYASIENSCADRDEMWYSHSGLTANMACCVCGGGTPTTSKPTSKKPTSKPSTRKPTSKPSSRKPTFKPSTRKPTVKPVTKAPTRKPTVL